MLTSNRTNEDWLSDLTGPSRDAALADLRAILLRGLTGALSGRVPAHQLDDLVEDSAQEALLKVLGSLPAFRGESYFTTWAHKIAVRVAFSELRRQRWKDVSLEDLVPEQAGPDDYTPAVLADRSPAPEAQAERRALGDLVTRLVYEELSGRQRQALLAVVSEGMPLEEVARRLNTNRNALYKLLHDARLRLHKRLAAEGLTPAEVLAAFEAG